MKKITMVLLLIASFIAFASVGNEPQKQNICSEKVILKQPNIKRQVVDIPEEMDKELENLLDEFALKDEVGSVFNQELKEYDTWGIRQKRIFDHYKHLSLRVEGTKSTISKKWSQKVNLDDETENLKKEFGSIEMCELLNECFVESLKMIRNFSLRIKDQFIETIKNPPKIYFNKLFNDDDTPSSVTNNNVNLRGMRKARFDKNNLDIKVGVYDAERKLYRYNEHLFIRNYTEEKMKQANFPEDLILDTIFFFNDKKNGDYAILDIDKYLVHSKGAEDDLDIRNALGQSLEGPSLTEGLIESLKDDNHWERFYLEAKENFKDMFENWDTIFGLMIERFSVLFKEIFEMIINRNTEFIMLM